MFIAEKQSVNRYKPYWDSEAQKEGSSDKSAPHSFKKFLYNDEDSNQKLDFGETLTNKKHSVIVVYDLKEKKIKIIDIQALKKKNNIDNNGMYLRKISPLLFLFYLKL